MSNPGVINLFSIFKKSGIIQRFQVEDNIGESIHIHINNLRLDLTIDEFYKLVNSMRKNLNELSKPLDLLNKYEIDPLFFRLLAPFLKDLNSTKIKKIKIKDLKFIVRKKYSILPEVLIPESIINSPIYRSLLGKESIDNYKQINYPGISNKKRLNSLRDDLTLESYNKSKSFVICFNDQLYVRDGQHRCAVLAKKYGINAEIDVLFLNFQNKHNFFPLQSFLNAIKSFIKIIIKFLISQNKKE